MSDPLEPLSPQVVALLGKLPSVAAAGARKAAVWDRIASSASVLDTATGVAAGAAAGTASTAATGAVTAKLVVPLVIAAVVGGVGGGVALDRTVLAPPPKVIVKTERVEVPVRIEVPVPVAPEPEPEPVKPAPAPVKPKPVVTAEERQLIEAAQTALIKRNPAGALDALALHRKSFAKGQQAEERDALEIQALAQAGRLDDARAAAKRFSAAYPHSVFGPAVDAAVK